MIYIIIIIIIYNPYDAIYILDYKLTKLHIDVH